MNWLLARLKEPSTWRGLIWLATAFGVSLRPEVWEQIAAVGMALAGLVGVVTGEKPASVRVELPPIALVGKPETGFADRESDSASAAAAPVRPGVAGLVSDSPTVDRLLDHLSSANAPLPSNVGRGLDAASRDEKAGWNG